MTEDRRNALEWLREGADANGQEDLVAILDRMAEGKPTTGSVSLILSFALDGAERYLACVAEGPHHTGHERRRERAWLDVAGKALALAAALGEAASLEAGR